MIETKLKGKATILADSRETDFSFFKMKVGKMQTYKDQSKKIVEILKENEKEIEAIGERYHADILIACSHKFFRYIVSCTQEHEIDINLFVSKDRKIIHYTSFGIEPAVLLIALDD